MGAYLNTPKTEKEQEEGENSWIRFASTSMQGWRAHQEDAHNCILDFDPDLECSLFGVYDGHGGAEVAIYIAQNFPQFLKDNGLSKDCDVSAALKKGFVSFDKTLLDDEVVQIMNTLKEADGSASRNHEIDEAEEREQLFEEAMVNLLPSDMALSKEASVSLETIIRQYAKIRNRMDPGGGISIVETKTEKRTIGEPSSRLVKRRRIQRENATIDDVDNGNGSDSESITSGSEIRAEGFASATKINGKTNGSGDKDLVDQKSDVHVANDVTSEEKSVNDNSITDTLDGIALAAAGDKSSKAGDKSSNPSDKKIVESAKQPNIVENSIACEETAVTSSTSIVFSASNTSNAKMVDGEADSNTDEDDEDEDYEAGADGEEEEVVDESESEDDEKEEDDSNGPVGNKPGFDSGATACVALLYKNKVIVANVGDSRAVLCRDGKAIDLSVDHKPEDEQEKSRIEKAGGIVSEDGRVNGGLNLSRALGDHYYKSNAEVLFENQMISSVPDIVESELTEKDTLLIVGCDGIWNSLSSQEVVDFVNERIGTKSLKEIGADICSHCCAPDTSGDGTGCDNMTIIIIDLSKSANGAVDVQSKTDKTVVKGNSEEPLH